jgi:hypothetical protein
MSDLIMRAIYVDFDDVMGKEIKSHISSFPFVKSVFNSFGGGGLGAYISVKGVTFDNFKLVHKQITDALGVEADKCAVKATQPNVLSYDPEIYINANPSFFPVNEQLFNQPEEPEQGEPKKVSLSYK